MSSMFISKYSELLVKGTRGTSDGACGSVSLQPFSGSISFHVSCVFLNAVSVRVVKSETLVAITPQLKLFALNGFPRRLRTSQRYCALTLWRRGTTLWCTTSPMSKENHKQTWSTIPGDIIKYFVVCIPRLQVWTLFFLCAVCQILTSLKCFSCFQSLPGVCFN